MNEEEIDLKHQKILEPLFQKLCLSISEYHFSLMYLYRRKNKCQVLFDKEIFLKGVTFRKEKFLMPTSTLESYTQNQLADLLKREGGSFFPIPEIWLDRFDPQVFTSSSIDSESDYLYISEKIHLYPGRHLQGKRNLVHQFEKQYTGKIYKYSVKYYQDALLILNEWQKDSQKTLNETDYHESAEALEKFDILKLCGLILYANEKPAGFILGEKGCPKTFILHYAKGLTKFKGIYAYMYKEMAHKLMDNCEFLNFEDDLDDPGMRKAKLSYQPDEMIKKFHIKLK